MLIDWFTVIAQGVNFLVLVLLLKRLLYKPVLAAIDERQAKIKQHLSEAAAAKKTAVAEKSALKDEKATFDAERDALMAKAVADAGAERQKLLDAAKSDSQAFRDKLAQAAKDDEEKNRVEIIRRLQHQAFSIAGKVLSDLASVDLDAQMAEGLAHRISTLSPDEKGALVGAMNGSQSLVVRSAAELDDASKATLSAALKKDVAPEAAVQFEVRPDLVNGVEVAAGGYRLDWNVASSISALENQIGAATGAEQPPIEAAAAK